MSIYIDNQGNFREVPAGKEELFLKKFPGGRPATQQEILIKEEEKTNKAVSTSQQSNNLNTADYKPASFNPQTVEIPKMQGVSPFKPSKPLDKSIDDVVFKEDLRDRNQLVGSAINEFASYKNWIDEINKDESLSPSVKNELNEWYKKNYRDTDNPTSNIRMPSTAMEYLEKNKEEVPTQVYMPGSPQFGGGQYVDGIKKENTPEQMAMVADFLVNSPKGRKVMEDERIFLANLDKSIDDLEKEIYQVAKKRNQDLPKPESLKNILMRPKWEKKEKEKEYNAIMSKVEEEYPFEDLINAENQLNELKKLRDAYRDGDKNAIKQFTKEFGRRLPYDLVNAGTFGFLGLADQSALSDALSDPKNKLTRKAYDLLGEYQQAHKMDRSIAQDIAMGTSQMLPFVAQFIASEGIVSAATKLPELANAGKGMRAVLKASETLQRPAVRMMVTPQLMTDAYRKNIENPGSFLDALAQAIPTTYVEYFTEDVGRYIPEPKPKNKIVKKLMERTGVQGGVGEMMEEEIGMLLQPLADNSHDWSALVDPRSQIVTAGTIAAMQLPYVSIAAGGYAAGKARNIQQKRSIRKGYNMNIANIKDVFKEEGDELISFINSKIDTDTEGTSIPELISVLDDEEMTDVQKNAIAKYALSYMAYSSLNKAKEEIIQEQAGKASQSIEGYVNPQMNAVVSAVIGNSETPLFIVGGNIVLKEDGSVDTENSDSEIYYIDENGKKQVTSIDFVGSVSEIIPSEEAKRQAVEITTSPIIAQQENDEVRAYEPGEVVSFSQDGNTRLSGPIYGTDQNGNYIVQVSTPAGITQAVVEPRNIINEDNLRTIDNGAIVNYRDESGNLKQGEVVDMYNLRNQGLIAIGDDVVPVSNVIGIAENTNDGQETESVPKTATETVDGPTAEAIEEYNSVIGEELPDVESEIPSSESGAVVSYLEKIPADQKGNKLFEQAPVETTVGALNEVYNDPTELNEVVASNIEGINKQIAKLQKPKPTGDINKDIANKLIANQQLAELNARLTYWNDVLNAVNTMFPAQEEAEETKPQDVVVKNEITTEEDRLMYIAQNSNDVQEIAKAYKDAMHTAESENLQEWESQLLGRKVNRASFENFGDKNYINGTIARSWFNRKGEEGVSGAIDVIAQELGVSEEEIIDFILRHPSNVVKKGNSITDALNERFKEVASKMTGYKVGGIESSSGKMLLKGLEIAQSRPESVSPTIDLEVPDILISFLETMDLEIEQISTFEELMYYVEQGESMLWQLSPSDFATIKNYINNARQNESFSRTSEKIQETVSQRAAIEDPFSGQQESREYEPGYEFSSESQSEPGTEPESGSQEVIPTEEETPVTEPEVQGQKVESAEPVLQEQAETNTDTPNKLPSLFDTTEYEGKELYHGSPDGVLDMIDPYAHTQNWREGLGFYTTESKEAAQRYADGKTATGERKEQQGGITPVVFPADARVLDMDAPADVAIWGEIAKNLDVTSPDVSGSNMEAYNSLIDSYNEDSGSNEGQYAVEEALSIMGYDASTHIEGKNSVPHRVFIWKNEYKLPEIKKAAEAESPGPVDIVALSNEVVKKQEIAQAEAETNTNPTVGQKEAGNYKKGKVTIQGFDISIEQPKGSVRSGRDASGKEWSVEMQNTYGYIRGTKGKDGDHIDVFVGPHPESKQVFVVDQVKPAEKLDLMDVISMPDGQITGIVFNTLKKVGDKIKVGGRTYEVTRLTKPQKHELSNGKTQYRQQITLTDDRGGKATATKISNEAGETITYYGEGAWQNLSRDIEGDIILSSQAYDHPTDSYTRAIEEIDRINREAEPEFDEHKVMLGFNTIEEAREAYLSNYEEGWQGLGNITPVDVETFRKWAESGTRRIKPFAEYASINKEVEVISEEEYLNRNGAAFMKGADAALHHNIKDDSNKRKNIARVSKAMQANNQRREELRKEYAEKVANGELREPTRIERLIQAAQGHEDLKSTHAARRLLEKQGIDYRNPKLQNTSARFKPVGKGKFKALIDRLKKTGLAKDVVIDQAAYEKKLNEVMSGDPAAMQTLSEMESIKQKAIANGTFLLAPNGKPTKLTESQWLQVRTSNFRKWFGDWEKTPETASKVVDENGEPMVVYHATQGDFDAFDKSTFGKSIDEGTLGQGFYFVSDEIVVSNYARNLSSNTGVEGNEGVMPVFLNIKNPYVAARVKEVSGNDKKESARYSDKLIKKGHDGVEVLAYPGHNFVGDTKFYNAFEPTQIKSAISNNGEFDSSNPDIRMQVLDISKRVFSRIDETLREQNKSTYPKIKTRDILGNEVSGLEAKEEKRAWDKVENQDYKTEHVSFSEIVPTQQHVSAANLERVSKSDTLDKDDPVVLAKHAGKYYILDGHHRISALKLSGNESAEAVVVDLDGEVQFMRNSMGDVYGFVTSDGTVYLNPSKMNANTPIHEFAHLWNSFVKENNPELYAKGKELIMQSEYWQKVNSNPTYSSLSEEQKVDEAMAMAIGDKGEMQVLKNDIVFLAKLKTWLNNVWNAIKEMFGIPTKVDIENMTLSEFTDIATKDLLGGKALDGSKEVEEEDNTRFQSVDDVVDNVQASIMEDRRNELDKRLKNLMFKLREAWEDRHLAVKEFLDLLRENGTEVAEYNDYYKQATHINGKNDAQLEHYNNTYQKPLNESIAELQKAGYSFRDIENYAILKHGLERNEWMRNQAINEYVESHPDASTEEINEFIENLPEDYSGVKEVEREVKSEAESFIKEFEAKVGEELAQKFWKNVNAATHFSLKKQYEGGLIDKKLMEELIDRYNYYIPLRGHDAETAEDRWDYSPDTGTYFVSPVMKANGRRSRAEKPFAYIAQAAQSAISSANKNTLNQTLLRLARKDKTGLLVANKSWYVMTGFDEDGKPVFEIQEPAFSENPEQYIKNIEEFEEKMQELQEHGLAQQRRGKLDLGKMFIKPRQKEQHAITVYQNGVPYNVYVNANPAVSRAVNGINSKDLHKDLKFIAKVSRQMAANFTTRNPAFVISNFSRDYIFASSILMVKEDAKYTASFHRNIPKAAAALQRSIRGKGDLTNIYDQYAVEFTMNGGKTGFSHILELQRVQKQIERDIEEGDKKHIVGRFIGAIDSANEFVENLSRFSVYVTSRERGRSIIQSISDAKEVTVNFNRSGAGGYGSQYIRPLYLFVNAGIQALSNFAKAANKNKGKAAMLISTYSVTGFIMPLLSMMVGGDDGYEEYLKLSDWERQNNLCLYTGNGFIKLPLPHELRVFHKLGDNVYQSVFAEKDKTDAFIETILGFADLIPANPTGAVEASWAELFPDAIRPFMQLAANKNFTGSPITNKWVDKNKPGYLKVRTNKKGDYYAPSFLVKLAELTDKATGGDGVEKGLVSFNPDVINHIMHGYFGGLYSLSLQSLSVAEKTFDFTATGELNIKSRDVPIARSFYVSSDDLLTSNSGLNSKYYKVADDVKEINRLANEYKKKAEKGELGIDKFAEKLQTINIEKSIRLSPNIKLIQDYEKLLKEVDKEEQRSIEEIIAELKREVVEMNNQKE